MALRPGQMTSNFLCPGKFSVNAPKWRAWKSEEGANIKLKHMTEPFQEKAFCPAFIFVNGANQSKCEAFRTAEVGTAQNKKITRE